MAGFRVQSANRYTTRPRGILPALAAARHAKQEQAGVSRQLVAVLVTRLLLSGKQHTCSVVCEKNMLISRSTKCCSCISCRLERDSMASLAQLAEHALRKRTVVGSIPTGGLFHQRPPALTTQTWRPLLRARLMDTRSLQRMSRRDSRRFQDQHDSASEWLRRWTRNPLGSARRGFESPRCRYSSHFLTRDVKDCPCASYLVCFVCGGGGTSGSVGA